MTAGTPDTHALGLDVGAVSVSAVETGPDGGVVRSFYELHHGDVASTVRDILHRIRLQDISVTGATTSTPAVIRTDTRHDNQICLITAGREYFPDARSILVIGGERFGRVRFDENGEYLSFKANPLCAAGTGGFLDQQARRLNLDSTEQLATLALANRSTPPRIASRCAVFAKTDLVHAQQEGHSLEAICDGLCRGLAKNIVDTLFTGEPVLGPLLLAGGVAKNQAVVAHLRDLLEVDLVAARDLPLAAAGAAIKCSGENPEARPGGIRSPSDVVRASTDTRSYEHPPLELELSGYPEFDSLERYLFSGRVVEHSHSVEVDLYRELAGSAVHTVYLGIDIGSTSTKAVVTSLGGDVLAGFYTSTAGQPLLAVRLIFETIEHWADSARLDLVFAGVSTTGSGRKFIGKIVRADLVLDEITAHARAAVELHPDVDTILEIGGQDSKFTTLRDGRVTLSVMNSVCAAGTGSFIEEQAKRLDVPLTEYATHTHGHRAPLASERCTVFMERDLNHYLGEGYERGEALAAVLHSVRENYLNNVAVESAIGETVVFQGATARNRALIAAFEQRLRQPILVSKFCHLTGALGGALTLRDGEARLSSFRGLDLHRSTIPIRSETCDLCTNHCKLSVADVDGETVAYGFLCGRDYHTRRRVDANASGFDLLKERRRAFRSGPSAPTRIEPVLGIPSALHVFEDVPFWTQFFRRLGIRTVTSGHYPDAVKHGRLLSGAELCAPLTALHAHVRLLLDRADYVFLPFYLEKKPPEKTGRRQFCYYTQFAPSLGAGPGAAPESSRILTPLVHSLYSSLVTKAELYRMLRSISPGEFSFREVSSAYEEALASQREGAQRLRDIYRGTIESSDDMHVVLLGRPYSAMAKGMNKRIPEMFAELGIPVFYQDMLTYGSDDVARIAPLLDEVHWHHAARILEAAEVVATTPRAYPVFVTSFKCSPDSFLLQYFRQILEHHGKPYLVLQLDEHDSRLGYETRIEAGARAFRNHFASQRRRDVGGRRLPMFGAGRHQPRNVAAAQPVPAGRSTLDGRTILFPNWDQMTLPLVVGALRRRGLDARLLEETQGSIRRGVRQNSGQCMPLNVIAQGFIEYVRDHDLDPARCVLWIPASSIACNIRLYPNHIRDAFHREGGGFEQAGIFAGSLSLQDISASLPLDAYLAYMFGGFFRRITCRIRPYERWSGETDRVAAEGLRLLARTFEEGGVKDKALAQVLDAFEAIECVEGEPRPEVAIFGDMYSRDNDVLNQDLVRFIEAHGGEVITTPYTSYVKMIVRPYYWKWFLEGKYMNVLSTGALMAAVAPLERKYFPYFEKALGEPQPSYDASPQAVLAEYNVRMEHTGESMDNLLKIFYTARHHPEVALFVQASPAFCCPSLVTEAMSREIEQNTGVPIVSVTYDGSGGNKNDVILPYLEYPRGRGGRPSALQMA
jgi:predicted CoA-substrate-specific enzyme activase